MNMFKVRYRFVYIFLLGVYSFINLKFTEGDTLLSFPVTDLALIFFLLLFVSCIWEGNRFLAGFASKLQFRNLPYSQLIAHFCLSFLMILLLTLLVDGLVILLNENEPSHFKQILGFNFRINLFLHCIHAIFHYRTQMETLQLETEQFKKQTAEAQFDALSKQLNPHFLFNSFNVLSNLVDQDQQTAQRFINQLSGVYRYLLKNQDNRLVKLEEEMNFLESYIYLMKIRFQDSLVIKNQIQKQDLNQYIAPSTLQLLIENAIKHNEVSKQAPLAIDIYRLNDHLIVENSIRLKEQRVESSNVGLKNIKSRYAFLSDQNPLIINSNGKFTVKIPLIEVENL